MATTSAFGWETPDDTDLVKDGAAAIRTLGNSIDTSMSELKGGTTGQILSKTSNTDMDFTWVAPTSGDITGVTAGTGITGGGTSGTVTVSFDEANFGGAQGAAGKNAVINGAMEIWQRGTTSGTVTTAKTFVADRWFSNTGGGSPTYTASRSTDVPSGFQYSLKLQRTSGQGATTVYVQQDFETVTSIPYAGKAVTLSFYAKAGANFSPGTINALLVSGTGTDQTQYFATYTGQATVASSTPTITTSWQRFTLTGTVGSTATQLGIQFNYGATGTAGADDSIYITGVQVELGSTATPFKRSTGTIQGELAACQRYYYRVNNESGTGSLLAGFGSCDGTTIADILVPFPATMRVSPTSLDQAQARIYNLSNGTNYSGGTWTLAGGNAFFGGARYTHGSGVFTAGSGVKATSSGSGSAYLGFSAEL